MIKHFLKEIKYAYQRVRFGYDERIMWNWNDYIEQFLPSLKKVCQKFKEENIKDGLGEQTIKLIDDYHKLIDDYHNAQKLVNNYDFTNEVEDNYINLKLKEHKAREKLWLHISKNIGAYWE